MWSGLQEIKSCDLRPLEILDSGNFGEVFYGTWRGSNVTIKIIKDRYFGEPSEKMRRMEEFLNEAVQLAGMRHPNVLTFFGVSIDEPNGAYAIVTEHMINGSLRKAMITNEILLDERNRTLIAMDTAIGMKYMHRHSLVHFDLKSDNLFLNLSDPQRPICKIGNLGLSKIKQGLFLLENNRGTLPWMAPELLNNNNNHITEKVDVYSFGILMWELLTGEYPYTNLQADAIREGILGNTLRPIVPNSCNNEWRALMEQCWSHEAINRPSFTVIAQRLRSMARPFYPRHLPLI